MISVVDTEINGTKYNRCLELSDWRFSATAVGLIRFFEYSGINHYIDKRKLFYNFDDVDITQEKVQEKYLWFVEFRFPELMHHIVLMELYEKVKINDDDIKKINEKFSANTIIKKVFKGIKYGDLVKEEIESRIDSNRLELILNTYINSVSGYRKYSNISCFGKSRQERCRLLGYYVDTGRKTKSLGFNFNKASATVTDEVEFDYIPFAFSKGRESIFLNNNTSVKLLLKTNNDVDEHINKLGDKNASWNDLFYRYLYSSRFIKQDTEIIMKKIETDYYETVFVRKSAIDTFIEISKKNDIDKLSSLELLLKRRIKVNDNYYLNISELLTAAILNGILLDDLIERIFKIEPVDKNSNRYDFIIGQLILINTKMYMNFAKLEVEGNMDSEKYLRSAYASAKEVTVYFRKNNLENKTNSYRQKLISSIIANDYDRFIEIMLQLSSYTQKSFGFMHALIKDFEANKNLAYEFINSLGDYKNDIVKAGSDFEEVKNEK